MRGWTRLLSFFLALGLLCGLSAPASANVMTLGVWFRGIVEAEDGSTTQIPLEGSFRVTQGGLERGVIQAGVNTVNLEGTDPVTLTPMVETIQAGWDLSGATVTVNMTEAGNVTVPILVRKLTEGSVAAAQVVQTSAADSSSETAVIRSETSGAAESGSETSSTAVVVSAGSDSGKSDGTGNSGTSGTDTPASSSSAIVVPSTTTTSTVKTSTVQTSSVVASAPTVTPEWAMTPVPTVAPTPEPELRTLTASPETGTFHVKVFYDSNSNGDCSVYEKGVEGIPVYLISDRNEAVTGGKTNADGEITLAGVTPGSYRIRVVLPEEWGFNRKSKDTGLNKSVMDFSSEAAQESEAIRISAGETAERGVGLLKGVVVDGVCWLDVNADGVMDADEPKVAGARITLEGQKNGLSFDLRLKPHSSGSTTRIR